MTTTEEVRTRPRKVKGRTIRHKLWPLTGPMSGPSKS